MTLPETTRLALGIPGFRFEDLHSPERLRDLDTVFVDELRRREPELCRTLEEARRHPDAVAPSALSNLLVALAPHLSSFLARLFPIEEAWTAQMARAEAESVLGRFKRDFLVRRVVKSPLPEGFPAIDFPAASRALRHFETTLFPELPWGADEEMATAKMAVALLDAESEHAEVVRQKKREAVSPETRERVARWAARAGETVPETDERGFDFLSRMIKFLENALHVRLAHPEGKREIRSWSSFRLPEKLDFETLVETVRPDGSLPERRIGPPEKHRRRDGFKLTDPRMTPRGVQAETQYCLICHDRDKDSCSKGFFDAKTSTFQKNPLGVALTGCPLDEKISEMHVMRRRGDSVAALAIVCVDNPMCPGTGHRICNDCMKGCIFQKQSPVDIPQAETGILTDVLDLPYGFEVYSLLTRWNPLNIRRPYTLPYNGKNVLIVGLGPAGYTLAHYLANEGFGVAAIDGLKIEPIDTELVPVESYAALKQPLDERPLGGFGGVSEYGITVRWDKNFLRVIALTLARRENFRMFGGVRFGGTVDAEEAFAMGFDHVAVAAGAGRPTIVGMTNNMIRGIRQASDFLMALQLTGAFKKNGLANLQAELPAVVIGGGLTAIDTATELLAYYPIEAERTLERYENLVLERGEENLRAIFDAEEQEILDRLLAHGGAVRRERREAAARGEAPDFARLCRQWGGVSIVYRRTMEESPAYRLNHEEIIKALEEGISFVETLDPVEAVPDEYGKLRAMRFRRTSGELVELPARSCLVAAGTTPNITYAKEKTGTLPLDEKRRFFAPHRLSEENGRKSLVPCQPLDPGGIFTGLDHGGKFMTYFGDNHPRYNGNVVKAMASARDGYRWITRLFREEIESNDPAAQSARNAEWKRFSGTLEREWTATVVRVDRLTPTIVEVVVRAPAAARRFHPGQFYRLQNFEASAPRAAGSPLLLEPLALTGAWKDDSEGLLSMIALEIGVSSRLCAALKPGERVIVMGPTGAPTEIPEKSTVMLCGGGLGNAVLFSIGKACRAAGNRVIYFAGYKKGEDFYKREEIEAAADIVVFSVDRGEPIPAVRPQDRSFVGNILESITAYAEGRLGDRPIDLHDVSRIIVIGSDRMMSAVAAARHNALAKYLSPNHVGVASINSPMQCMMKEVCAQCLQKHRDPVTGATKEIVFSCFNQDQLMDEMDWGHLAARLRQNTVAEKLSGMWLESLLALNPIARV
ncbi:MAG TPA: FAD-dependent oxidoreductase [Thermoanaerobaculia bacterium]|nr:FAD-dependent oxidoreductase [Thermoanaerobaculia bacterium]